MTDETRWLAGNSDNAEYEQGAETGHDVLVRAIY
jgi:hypothetical protein